MKSFAKFEHISEKYAGGDQRFVDQMDQSARDLITTSKLSKLRREKLITGADAKKSKRAQGGKAVKTGIQNVMNRTKKKAQDLKDKGKAFAKDEDGRRVGRSTAGAFKSVFDFKPDTERTDTGAGGMGTAMRNMTNVGKAAMSGIVNAPAERLTSKKKTVGGNILNRLKNRLQKRAGITDKEQTPQAQKITTGKGGQIAKDLEKQTRTGGADSLPASQLAKNPSGGKTTSTLSGRMAIKRDELRKKREEKESKPYVDKTGRQQKSPVGSSQTEMGAKTIATNKSGQKLNLSSFKAIKRNAINRGKQRYAQAKKMSNVGRTITKKTSQSTQGKLPLNTISLSSSGVKDSEGLKKALQDPDANFKSSEITPRKANQTKVSQPTEPRKNNVINKKQQQLSFLRRLGVASKKPLKNIQKRLNLTQRQRTQSEETMNLKEINAIAIRKELANKGIQTKARSFDEIQQEKIKSKALERAKKRGGSVMVTNDESYSHWREEFIWETDKKYPEKIKEIKPMSGKNNITINPEDETSKYKRGY